MCDHGNQYDACAVCARDEAWDEVARLRALLATARADGYRAGIEAAAKVAADHHLPSKAWRKSIADSIRALAPANNQGDKE